MRNTLILIALFALKAYNSYGAYTPVNISCNSGISVSTLGQTFSITMDTVNIIMTRYAGVPKSRTITINGVAQDLSENREWGISTPTILSTTSTLDFPNTTAGNSSNLTVSLTGAELNDVVMLGCPNGSVPSDGCYFSWVSAANTVSVRYVNNNLLASVNPASGTFTIKIIK